MSTQGKLLSVRSVRTQNMSGRSEFFEIIWFNTKEAAEYLRTDPKQIRNWVYQGKVKAYRLLGKSLRFKKIDLDLLIKGAQEWE